MKRFQGLRGAILHDPHQDAQSFVIRDIFVSFGKRSKTSMMLHENLNIVFIMVNWDVRFEDVEPFPIQQTDKLHHKLSLIFSNQKILVVIV